MRKKLAAICLITTALVLSGCGEKEETSVPSEIIIDGSVPETEQAEEQMFPLTLDDGTVIDHSPDSVASLSPAVTEILSELGYGDRICAVSRYCDFPEGICTVTAGSCENPDIGRLTGLSPDVLFTLTTLAEREKYALEQAGITIVDLSAPSSVEDYAGLYSTISAVFEGKQAGTGSAEKARNALESASAAVQLGTFVYVTPKLTCAGAGTFESAVLSLCGENLFKGDGYGIPDEEAAVPGYIIAADTLSESEIKGNERLAEMISGGAEIIFISAERFERPSARICEVFTSISGQLTDQSE